VPESVNGNENEGEDEMPNPLKEKEFPVIGFDAPGFELIVIWE
jgi:hypothetical protein